MKKSIFYFFNLILYNIARFIPKNEKIWVFGSWFGQKYADNSKYLFEYINTYHPEIRAVWITSNNAILKDLRNKKYECYKKFSISSIILGLRAKNIIVVQNNLVDLMPFLNQKKTNLMQLWHGIPLKKIGFDDNLHTQKTNKLKKKLFPFLEEKYSLIIACSREDQKNFETAFLSEKVCITGYPRNDILVTHNTKSRNISYLPTFRKNVGDHVDLFSNYLFDHSDWHDKLSLLNSRLKIRMHPVNLPNKEQQEEISQFDNMSFINQDIDTAEVLHETDILITDYSSVYFDYLLTGNPIIFAPFDYDQYLIEDRELYYHYDQIIPGPKCKNWEEVLLWVEKFIKNPNLYRQEREEIKNRFHRYQDSNNCQRVFKEIKKLNK